VLADVTGRADDPLAHEPCVEDRAALGLLLREGGVAGQAEPGGLRIAAPQICQLARDAGPHAPRVQCRPPVGVLCGVTGAATLGREGRLEGGEARGRSALWSDRPPPVAVEKLANRRPVVGSTRDIAGPRDAGKEFDDASDDQRGLRPRKHA